MDRNLVPRPQQFQPNLQNVGARGAKFPLVVNRSVNKANAKAGQPENTTHPLCTSQALLTNILKLRSCQLKQRLHKALESTSASDAPITTAWLPVVFLQEASPCCKTSRATACVENRKILQHPCRPSFLPSTSFPQRKDRETSWFQRTLRIAATCGRCNPGG